ncbi:MAG: hypothetical protein AAGA50_17670 [Pseudomonadota bacterium]
MHRIQPRARVAAAEGEEQDFVEFNKLPRPKSVVLSLHQTNDDGLKLSLSYTDCGRIFVRGMVRHWRVPQ